MSVFSCGLGLTRAGAGSDSDLAKPAGSNQHAFFALGVQHTKLSTLGSQGTLEVQASLRDGGSQKNAFVASNDYR